MYPTVNKTGITKKYSVIRWLNSVGVSITMEKKYGEQGASLTSDVLPQVSTTCIQDLQDLKGQSRYVV